MKQKLTRAKDYPACCRNCAFGNTVDGDTEVLCARNGVMQPEDKCNRYVYDPLKRKPLRQVIDTDYKPEEFEL